MADVAITFHWRPSDMDAMDVAELMAWRARAEARSRAPDA
ncbi:GpE family phage tail protein [Ottowia sp.]|nr:GpE family phage tail protein [Ottowia sp.]